MSSTSAGVHPAPRLTVTWPPPVSTTNSHRMAVVVIWIHDLVDHQPSSVGPGICADRHPLTVAATSNGFHAGE